MKECLPYHEKALFDSKVVFMQGYDEEKWMRLKNRFYNIIKQEESDEFQEQMKRFKYNFSTIRLEVVNHHISEVWRKNEKKSPLLYKLSRAMMVVPYSSC